MNSFLFLIILLSIVNVFADDVPLWKKDPGATGALEFAILSVYYRGTVTFFSGLDEEEEIVTDGVTTNGIIYKFHCEIILSLNPCYVDYYEVWDRGADGYLLLKHEKTTGRCRDKMYAEIDMHMNTRHGGVSSHNDILD